MPAPYADTTFTPKIPDEPKTQSLNTTSGIGTYDMSNSCQMDIIKLEESPSPELTYIGPVALPTSHSTVAPNNDNAPTPVSEVAAIVDPRDPEGFLKRCSGFKKTKARCNVVIGKKSEQSCHPTFLPTCRTHRDQQSFAGWCQYQFSDGERCSRLFRWTPPYFELCTEHQGHPDTPCYFFRLPLELRHEVFRYLLPDRPIGSSTAQLHDGKGDEFDHRYMPIPYPASGPRRAYGCQMGVAPLGPSPPSVFPMPALDLFLVNRQFYQEAKDLLFSTVPFKIDVRKDGTFMCGRRLLEPRRADGSSHFLVDEADQAKQRFLKYFDWSAVKHYVVDILVENWASTPIFPNSCSWDEEVELYDIRGLYTFHHLLISATNLSQTTSPSSSPASSPNPSTSANSKSASASPTSPGPTNASSPTPNSSSAPSKACATSASPKSSASPWANRTTTRCSPSNAHPAPDPSHTPSAPSRPYPHTPRS
jgi:hypothetical protein